jgi:hypothetical protein
MQNARRKASVQHGVPAQVYRRAAKRDGDRDNAREGCQPVQAFRRPPALWPLTTANVVALSVSAKSHSPADSAVSFCAGASTTGHVPNPGTNR